MQHASQERSESPRRGRRSRRRHRHTPRDAKWLADQLSKSSTGGFDKVRSVVRVADEILRNVERIAWDVRGAAERTSSVWTEVRGDARAVEHEVSQVQERYQRLAATALMLGQVAVSYRFHGFRSAFMSKSSAARDLSSLHARNARRFYETSVEQGGAFLKVGQLLSARHDLLPAAWLAELGQLQDAVPALPYDTIETVVDAELGDPSKHFTAFEPQALAAASIGQVHRATTVDGTVVAVKVQRPGIAELIDADLSLLDLFIDAVRSMLPPTDLDTVRKEIRSVLAAETDYRRERETLAHLSTFFADHPSITVPRPVDSLCTDRLLTSEFVAGRKITDVLDELHAAREAGDTEAGARLDRIMGLLLEGYLRMVLEAGVFQADPHPGNLLVTEDDRLVILDFGAARSMSEETKQRYLGLVAAFVFDDKTRLVGLLDELGFRTQSGAPDTLIAFADALLKEMRHAVQSQEPFSWPTKEQLLEQAADLLRQADADPVTTLPAEFIMIARVFGTLGGLFGHYRPRVDVASVLLPLVGQAILGS